MSILVNSQTTAIVTFLQYDATLTTSTCSATASGTCNVGDDVIELVKKVNSLSEQDAINCASNSPYNIPPGLVGTNIKTTYDVVNPN